MKYWTNTLQKGSQGDEVLEWQKFLKSQGYYNGSLDGIFGDVTHSATTAYQTAVGLGADGIVGEKTWGKAGYTPYSNISTPTAAPTINPMPELGTYDTTSYDDTEKGQTTGKAYEDALEAYKGQDPFTFSQNDWLTQVLGDIKGYGDFSYDINGDALYQQYKDKYIQQGKMAMMDTMGQAAALTGGYGSSYAQSAGQQAYQGQLDNLNDIVPELYQMALDRYNMGKEDLYNQYGLLMQEYEKEYGLHSDEYNRLLDALGIAKDDYYNGADMFYTEQGNKNSVIGMQNTDAMNIWSAETEQKWNQAEWDEGIRQSELSNYWTEKEYDTLYGNSSTGGSGSDSSNGGNKGTTPSGVNYDNGSLTDAQIEELQEAIGVGVDGYWGPNSTKAAGGLTADEAWAAYQNGTLGIKPQDEDPKGWKDHNTEDLEKNQKENGGSYYRTAIGDVDDMISSGKSYTDLMAYAQEMVGNSLLSKSEYMSLVQYIRKKLYG